MNESRVPKTLGDLIDVYEAWRKAYDALKEDLTPRVADTVLRDVEASRDLAGKAVARQIDARVRMSEGCEYSFYTHGGYVYCQNVMDREPTLCRVPLKHVGGLPIL